MALPQKMVAVARAACEGKITRGQLTTPFLYPVNYRAVAATALVLVSPKGFLKAHDKNRHEILFGDLAEMFIDLIGKKIRSSDLTPIAVERELSRKGGRSFLIVPDELLVLTAEFHPASPGVEKFFRDCFAQDM